jgi:hypothetical protein
MRGFHQEVAQRLLPSYNCIWLWRKTSLRNQNRMSHKNNFDRFGARLREFISVSSKVELCSGGDSGHSDERSEQFAGLALELFALQFERNPVYRNFCVAKAITPRTASDWSKIPAVPTSAFKELELSCLAPEERTKVFHSSGTSSHQPSRHFHNAASLAIYEASLLPWFSHHLVPDFQPPMQDCQFVALTPPKTKAPHSSLVYMFDRIRTRLGFSLADFLGRVAAENQWVLDLDDLCETLRDAANPEQPMLMLGTAFSFVQLLDHLDAQNLKFKLPTHSRLLETGGYKGRSRALSKVQLHSLLSDRLGIAQSHIVSEYGMSELSSQAYDTVTGSSGSENGDSPRSFHFPPWARAQIISPETGIEVQEGETGLIRIFDLANVYSVMAIQTEDLGIRCGEGFELLGRAALAEPRGCSLTTP